jgi:serine/threonine protein kinase
MNTPKYNPPETATNRKDLSWDLFILGIIFYEILCGIHPFTGTTRVPYENLNTPEQKIQVGLFPFGSKANYFEVVAPPQYNFKNLPDKVQSLFLKCFDQGITNPAIRPNTNDWINNLTAKPKIIFFKSDRETIISGVEITLSWEVENGDEITINEGVGNVGKKGTIQLKPLSDRSYKIIAKNKFGTDEQEIQIATFPTPVLESLKVPMPDFTSRVSLNPIQISSPKIDVSINIDLMSSKPVFTEPSNELKTLRPQHKPKAELLNLSSIYESIRRKISR